MVDPNAQAGARPRVALVVPLGPSFGPFDRDSFAEALGRYPWLELWIAGTSAQRSTAQSVGSDPRVRFFEVESGATESRTLQAAMKAALSHDYPFVGYWGPDCEVPLAVLDDWLAHL